MKQYTVTKQDGYQDLRTFNKLEAENRLVELNKYSSDWFICEQGKDMNEEDKKNCNKLNIVKIK